MRYWTVAKLAFSIAAGAGLALVGVSAIRTLAKNGLAGFFGGLTEDSSETGSDLTSDSPPSETTPPV